MMKVDFYILETSDIKSRLLFACRLLEKAYKNSHCVYVYIENQKSAQEFDDLLWTYREESFVPHVLAEKRLNKPFAPIQIGHEQPHDECCDILLNLTPAIPKFYSQFKRVFEVIPNETAAQALARENYRFYRAQGCDITTHKIQTLESI